MVDHADGGSYTMRAIYAEIMPPERIVWTEPGTGMTTTSTSTSTSTSTDLGGARTEVRIHQANVPDTFRPEKQARFATSLDRFAAYLKIKTSFSA